MILGTTKSQKMFQHYLGTYPLYANSLFQSTPSVWRETKYVQTGEWSYQFQSTPSVWRETPFVDIVDACRNVFQSTPSVWRETAPDRNSARIRWYFNPLPPYGGRLRENSSPGGGLVFQSTPSVWRETVIFFNK